MQVRQIIQSSADILTITRLSPGDVYKRVDTTTYSGDPTMRFGVVQTVMNNGEDSAITAVEWESDYSTGAKATIKVFDGAKPAALYPATPDEVAAHIDGLIASAERALREAERTVEKQAAALGAVRAMAQSVGELTAPETSTELQVAPAEVADLVADEPPL